MLLVVVRVDLIKKDFYFKIDDKNKINDNKQELLLLKNYKSEIIPSQEKYSQKISYYIKVILGPYYDIFSSPRHIKSLFRFLPNFLCINFVYFGLLFNIEVVYDDIYIASLVVFFSEIFGEIISFIILTKFERKTLLNGTILLTGCFYLFGFFFQNYEIIRLFTILGGTILISVAYIALYLYVAENSDVKIKSSIFSILNILSMLLLFFFPDIFHLFKDLFALFAISCFSSLFLTYLIK